jgi:hypothetical protein
VPLAIAQQSTSALKCRAIEILAIGVIPFEQWADVFANAQFQSLEGLRAKAFAVWFTTMADFLKVESDWVVLRSELDRRKELYADVFERIAELARHYRNILSLYTIEDQIFMRDRRLQNVHGSLHIYARDEHDLPVFDSAQQRVVNVNKSADEYREIMRHYYPNLRESSKELLDRLLHSRQFVELAAYYRAKLEVGSNLGPLIESLGVGAKAPPGEPANTSLERTREG